MTSEPAEATPYERMGGAEFFATLCDRFYSRVETCDLLRPMYPPGDLKPATDRLRMFLEQYFGGPRTYSEQRGHPRLRARHMGYHIDTVARDTWLGHMEWALDGLDIDAEPRAELWAYFVRAADFMINTYDPNSGPQAMGSASPLTVQESDNDQK